jgi:hypothetical protein
MVFNEKTPHQFLRRRNANSRRYTNARLRGHFSRRDPYLGIRIGQIHAIVIARDSPRPAKLSRTVCILRVDSADQNGTATAFRLSDDIEAVVRPVDEVNIGNSGGTKHHLAARRRTPGGMARRLVVSICFSFNDRAGQNLAIWQTAAQNRPQQLARYSRRLAIVKVSRVGVFK